MTVMAFLLLIILFLVSFLYFSGLNPQEITIYYLPDEHFTFSVGIIVISCVLIGLVLGYLAHLYSSLTHLVKHWKQDREEKKARDVAAIYREGVLRLLSGDIKRAHSLLQRALDRDPSRVETLIAMASVYTQEGEPQECIRLLLKAKALEPRSLEVLFKLSATYEESGRDDDAAATLLEILAIESDNKKALRSLRELHIRHNRWQDALDQQKKLIKAAAGTRRQEEEKEKLLFLRYEVARQALEAGDVEQAKSEFKDIIKQAPDFVPARVSLGDAYRQLHRTQDAAEVWRQGYDNLDKSIFLSRLEDLYMEAEDPAALLTFFRNALLEKGHDLMLRLFFGKVCLRLEMIDEAFEQLQIVESSGVDFPQLHFLLAEGCRRRNRLEEAIAEYKKALGANDRLRLGFVCDTCSAAMAEWQSRCTQCGAWGSLSLAGRQTIKSALPMQLNEIHPWEREAWSEQD
ncbi:MAG: lipopolysaccharide assembly protein LapA domain-containing protein [Desulfuromonadales bacterium]